MMPALIVQGKFLPSKIDGAWRILRTKIPAIVLTVIDHIPLVGHKCALVLNPALPML